MYYTSRPDSNMGRGNFEGETGKPYRDTLRSSVQTRLNRSRCCFGCGLAWAQCIMCYMGGPDPPWERAILVDRGAHCKVYALSAVNSAKTAETIKLLFGFRTGVGLVNHVLHEVQIPTYGKRQF